MWSTSWPTGFPCERARADTGGSTVSAYLAGPCLGRRLARLYVGLLACLPLPALASDFTGLLTGMTLLLLAATLVMLLPLLLVRRHAWVRWLGTFVGVGVLLIGLGTAGVDTCGWWPGPRPTTCCRWAPACCSTCCYGWPLPTRRTVFSAGRPDRAHAGADDTCSVSPRHATGIGGAPRRCPMLCG